MEMLVAILKGKWDSLKRGMLLRTLRERYRWRGVRKQAVPKSFCLVALVQAGRVIVLRRMAVSN